MNDIITTQKWLNNVFIQIYSHSNFWKLGVPKNVIAMVCTDFAFALIKYNLKPYLLCEILLIPTFSKLFWIALFIENNFSFLLMLFLYWMVPLYKLWNRTVDCVVHMVFIHYIHRFNQSWSLNFNPNWKLNQPLARFCVESWQEPVHISQAQLVMKLLVCEILNFNIFFDARK